MSSIAVPNLPDVATDTALPVPDPGTSHDSSHPGETDRKLAPYCQPFARSHTGGLRVRGTMGDGNAPIAGGSVLAFPRFAAVHLPLFVALQKWEGTVLEVREDEFAARLVDLTNKGPDEYVELSIEEVADDDLRLVQPGAVFYWSIGYHTTRDGQKSRSSQIRFRRLPAWTPRELRQAQDRARQLEASLGSTPPRHATKA